MAETPQLLRGKTAAITGGLTGIGRAIAIGFLQHGCDVAINYLGAPGDAALLAELLESLPANGTELITLAGDISRPQTGEELVNATVKRWGRLDIFVSNAGVCKFEEFLSVSPDLLAATMGTNLHGAFFAVQAAARQMSTQTPPGGSIIGMSSISALVGGGQQTHYTPTKSGVLSLMQSCAVALGKYGIRCNALLPGTIRTGMNKADLKDQEKERAMSGRTALGRLGAPEDLVGPAVFLASDLSGYVVSLCWMRWVQRECTNHKLRLVRSSWLMEDCL
jgi:L-rhamnose 1-dehydrogenase